MLQKAWKTVVWLMQYHSWRKRAYQGFLSLLAQSPTEWTVLESGAITSSQGECPIVEVYQRTTKYGRADSEDRHDVLWAGRQLGLSQYQTLLIMSAADRWGGYQEQMRTRNDILAALTKAHRRTDATAEGVLAAECHWSEEKETVGV